MHRRPAPRGFRGTRAELGGGARGFRGPPAPRRPPPRSLLADALVELARGGAGSGDAPREDYQVVVNVDLDTLAADAPGACRLACGTVLAPETARRLGCDQPVTALSHKSGRPQGSAREARFASARLNRLLDQRDRGCRFPGCTHSRHLHSRHIVHWARGGRTSPDNLVRLCSHHHRLVHEGGYTISGDPAGELLFHRPDGRRLPQRPPRRAASADALGGLRREPDPAAITPDWHGDSLDLDWAVTVLLGAS